MLRKLIINLLFAFVALVLVWGTLLVPRPAILPERIVELGYPLTFVTMKAKPEQSGGLPETVLMRRSFSITSGRFRFTEMSY